MEYFHRHYVIECVIECFFHSKHIQGLDTQNENMHEIVFWDTFWACHRKREPIVSMGERERERERNRGREWLIMIRIFNKHFFCIWQSLKLVIKSLHLSSFLSLLLSLVSSFFLLYISFFFSLSLWSFSFHNLILLVPVNEHVQKWMNEWKNWKLRFLFLSLIFIFLFPCFLARFWIDKLKNWRVIFQFHTDFLPSLILPLPSCIKSISSGSRKQERHLPTYD